jgi:hypothetical protein
VAGDAHQPAHGLDQVVVAGALAVGPGLAEAGDRAVDELRVEHAQVFVGEAVLGQPTHLVVLDHHVRVGGELAGDLLPLLIGKIEGQRALAPIAGQVVGGGIGVVALEIGRTPAAGVVADAGAFDLDHLGAQVGQDLGRPGAGEDAAEIEDANVCERACHGVLPWAMGAASIAITAPPASAAGHGLTGRQAALP